MAAVPPVPPHAAWDRIEAAVSSVLHGDSDRAARVRQGVKGGIQEMLPGRRHRGDRPGAGGGDDGCDPRLIVLMQQMPGRRR